MADEETEEATTRVTMNWPTSVKDAVREKVGVRGLTEFTVAAVRQRLFGHDRAEVQDKEIGELRYLSQLLADRYAMGGSMEDRESMLMELELPSWMETKGWPAELAKLVSTKTVPTVEVSVRESGKSPMPAAPEVVEATRPSTAPTAEPEFKPCPYYRNDLQCELPSRHKEDHRNGDLVWDGEKAPRTASGNSLLDRVRDKAIEKGVDVGDLNLKPASEIPKPPIKEEHNCAFEVVEGGRLCACGTFIDDTTKPPTLTEPAVPSVEVPTESATSLQVPVDAPSLDACPKCGSELVMGECWVC